MPESLFHFERPPGVNVLVRRKPMFRRVLPHSCTDVVQEPHRVLLAARAKRGDGEHGVVSERNACVCCKLASFADQRDEHERGVGVHEVFPRDDARRDRHAGHAYPSYELRPFPGRNVRHGDGAHARGVDGSCKRVDVVRNAAA